MIFPNNENLTPLCLFKCRILKVGIVENSTFKRAQYFFTTKKEQDTSNIYFQKKEVHIGSVSLLFGGWWRTSSPHQCITTRCLTWASIVGCWCVVLLGLLLPQHYKTPVSPAVENLLHFFRRLSENRRKFLENNTLDFDNSCNWEYFFEETFFSDKYSQILPSSFWSSFCINLSHKDVAKGWSIFVAGTGVPLHLLIVNRNLTPVDC